MLSVRYGDIGKCRQFATKDYLKGSIAWLLSLCLLLFNSKASAENLFYIDIKQQPADKALILFAKQTNKTIVFSYELTTQYQTNPVKGYYSFKHGLTKLLRETGLSAQVDKYQQVSIVKAPIKPALSNTQKSQQVNMTNARILSPLPRPNSVEKISIIGSRTLARSIKELPVPVDILSNKMLTDTGQIEVGRMLQAVAPSFNFSSSSISDGTDVLKPATLRGLGPDQTLILVNGKRRHHASLIHINTSVGRGTSGSDLNAIPITAIKRVEILRDGAAAQYGSDAIAGVINIVLKDSLEGEVSTTIGQYQQGDGQSFNFSINKGFKLGSDGIINTTIQLQDNQATDRSGLNGECQYTQCTLLENGDYLAEDPREISAKRDNFEIGNPAHQQYAFSYNAHYSISDTSELYSFAIFSHRENESAAFFRHHNNREANPLLQDGNVLVPHGYLPYIHSDIVDSSFNLGFKTEFDQDIIFDISYTHGVNEIDYTTKNSVNASYASMLHHEHNYDANSIRKETPRSAQAYGLSLGLQTLNIDLQMIRQYFTASLGIELRQDKYQIDAGEKYSYFDYDGISNNPFTTNNSLGGIQGFPGIAPSSIVNEDRNVSSLYLELHSELNDAINIDGAVRYDKYDGFGDTSNIKLAAKWQINENVTLRSSISTGFKAPSMQQLYFNNLSTQFIVNDENELVAEQVGTFRNNSQLAQAIGIPELKEEKSSNFSLGALINFDNNFNITMDYYAIDIDDRIVISNKLSPEYSKALSQSMLDANVDKAQVFLNGADSETQGIDIVATWSDQFLTGELALTLAANFTETDVIRLYTPKDSDLHTLTVEQVFSVQDISIIEKWQPQDRLSINSRYHQDNWSLNLALNRYGEYTISDGDSQTYSAELITDIRVEHKFYSQLTWFAGINNVFGVTPDRNTIGNSHAGTIVDQDGRILVESSGVFKYSRRSAPFGFNGSYYYVGINYYF